MASLFHESFVFQGSWLDEEAYSLPVDSCLREVISAEREGQLPDMRQVMLRLAQLSVQGVAIEARSEASAPAPSLSLTTHSWACGTAINSRIHTPHTSGVILKGWLKLAKTKAAGSRPCPTCALDTAGSPAGSLRWAVWKERWWSAMSRCCTHAIFYT